MTARRRTSTRQRARATPASPERKQSRLPWSIGPATKRYCATRRTGIGIRPVGGEFHAAISSSLSAWGIVSTSSGSGRCGVRAWFLATSTDRGPLELCLSPSSWSDQGSTNRALHRTPQHRWCRGRAAKTLAVALDPRWLEPIRCLPPFADARGRRTSLQAMATHHG